MEKPSASWAEYEHESRDRYVKGRFTTAGCQACYYRPLCPKGKDRQLLLRLEKQDEALRATRALMESEEGKRLYQGAPASNRPLHRPFDGLDCEGPGTGG
jgi:hypothetical protein